MIDQSILKALSVLTFVFGWTYFGLTKDSTTFWIALATGFVVLFYAITYRTVKHRDFDWRINFIGFMLTLGNFVDEFAGDSQAIQISEYVFALLTLIIVLRGRNRFKACSYYDFFNKNLE